MSNHHVLSHNVCPSGARLSSSNLLVLQTCFIPFLFLSELARFSGNDNGRNTVGCTYPMVLFNAISLSPLVYAAASPGSHLPTCVRTVYSTLSIAKKLCVYQS